MTQEKNQVTDKGAVEIREEDLDQVQGGASDYLLELDGVKGESKTAKVEIGALKAGSGELKITPGSIRQQKV